MTVRILRGAERERGDGAARRALAPAEAATPLRERGPATVIVTLGADGVQCANEPKMFSNGRYDHVDGASRAFNGLLQPAAGIFA